MFRILLLMLFMGMTIHSCQLDSKISQEEANWAHYLGDKQSSQFKFHDEINEQNVKQLKVAWTYEAGIVDTNNTTQIQTNPLVIDGIVYGSSAKLKLFALDAATGDELWVFNPVEEYLDSYRTGVCRGLAYVQEGTEGKLLYAAGSDLFAINAKTGRPYQEFGTNGKVNLRKGLGMNADSLYLAANTPGVVFKDLYIMGLRVSESTGSAPGHIRAFDIKTGEQRWIFHTIPKPGEYGYDTWPSDAHTTSGGANSWAGMSLDEEREMVYVPTGSASFDFYGGDREGENLFANCILALDANTGERVWHYQTVHHDLWDKDLPAPPNLMTINIDGEEIDVVAQISKSGYLFVLDRETGESIYPIEEVEVAPSNLDGEKAWPTQPIPTVWPTISQTEVSEEILAIRSEQARDYAKGIWNSSLKGSQFIPMDTIPQIFFPGLDGAGEWGGAAHAKDDNTLYVNSNEQPWLLSMERMKASPPGERIYKTRCISCHGANLEGNELFGNVPSLIGLKDRLPIESIRLTIKNGRGIMPAQSLNEEQIDEVIAFIQGEEDPNAVSPPDASWPYPYRFVGYTKAMAPDGYSIFKPPWGQLTAIDMDNAEVRWQVPLGDVEELDIEGHPITGTENYGGPVVTSGGLIFIASTQDEKFRVFRRSDGKQLFEHRLPAAGYATPASYIVNGKQYIVIACGGGKLGTNSGDSYVAFSL